MNTTGHGPDPAAKVTELLVVAAAEVDCRAAIELLRHCAAQWSPAVPLKLLNGVEHVDAGGGRHAILLHPGFVALMVTRMMLGEAPSAALARVIAASEKMLARCRPLRRNLTVIDPHALLERPQELIAALEARLGVSGPATMPSSMNAKPTDIDPADTALLQVLAKAAMAPSPQAGQSAAEIEAMTLGSTGGHEAGAALPDQAFAHFTAIRIRMTQNATKADLLIEQVGQLEGELKRLGRDAAARDADIRRLQKVRNAFEEELAAARRHLSAVHASTSWRVTRPIRGVRRMMSGKAGSND